MDVKQAQLVAGLPTPDCVGEGCTACIASKEIDLTTSYFIGNENMKTRGHRIYTNPGQ